MALELEITDSRGIKVVFCRGKLVFGPEAEYFKNKVGALLSGSHGVVLQFKDLEHIDSQGVGTIVDLRNRALQAGSDVRLASISNKHVQKILDITKMGTVFQIFDNEQQAISSFGTETTFREKLG